MTDRLREAGDALCAIVQENHDPATRLTGKDTECAACIAVLDWREAVAASRPGPAPLRVHALSLATADRIAKALDGMERLSGPTHPVDVASMVDLLKDARTAILRPNVWADAPRPGPMHTAYEEAQEWAGARPEPEAQGEGYDLNALEAARRKAQQPPPARPPSPEDECDFHADGFACDLPPHGDNKHVSDVAGRWMGDAWYPITPARTPARPERAPRTKTIRQTVKEIVHANTWDFRGQHPAELSHVVDALMLVIDELLPPDAPANAERDEGRKGP